jgi:mRNA interferase RelE/StbE
MSYKVTVDKPAERKLENLPRDLQQLIFAKFDLLEQQPRPHGCRKLTDSRPPVWRLRIGKFRVIYTINDSSQVVEVLDIENRDSAYKKR